MIAPVKTWPRSALCVLIRGYQLGISGFLGNRCRFYPTCSSYAIDAIGLHGAVKGSAMAACRLAKCHPFHPGGIDPVPGSEGVAVKDRHSHPIKSNSSGSQSPLTHVN